MGYNMVLLFSYCASGFLTGSPGFKKKIDVLIKVNES